MLVCKCENIKFNIIEMAYQKYENDINMISDETGAGNVCGCCLSRGCEKVDISLPEAIEKIEKKS